MAKVGRPRTREFTLGYRVVKSVGTKLVSPYISNIQAIVEFKENKWAEPRIGMGPLCCFKTFKAAKHFRDTHTPYSLVYQVLMKPSTSEHVWTGPWHRAHLSYLSEGKVLADKVMLLSLVDDPCGERKRIVAKMVRQARLRAARRAAKAKAAKKSR